MVYFTYLRQGLVAILAFVGVKMLISDVYHVPTLLSLAVIAAVLLSAVGASILFSKPEEWEARGQLRPHEPALRAEED
jgi:tellurite resistance protein TerC